MSTASCSRHSHTYEVQVQGYRWGAGAACLAEGAVAPGADLPAQESHTLMWCRCKAIGGEQVLRAWLKEQ